MPTTDAPSAKWYEKHAWLIPFAIGLLLLRGALAHITGLQLEDISQELQASMPIVHDFVRMTDRELGIDLAGFAILVMVISAVSYRKGERWAWYALWIVPVLFLAQTVNRQAAGQTTMPGLSVPLVIAALLGLLLPYRTFFPRK